MLNQQKKNSTVSRHLCHTQTIRPFKGELNPKIDFSLFEHLGIVEQLYEVFLSC